MKIIKVIAVLVVSACSVSAITKEEARILNTVTSKYFHNDGVNYHVEFMKGKPHEKMYEFTNLMWKTAPAKLTEADIKNGITKKLHANLTCDTAFREKRNNEWSPWKQGGAYRLIWLTGKIFYTEKGLSYVANSPRQLKFYSKPKIARSSIKPATKKAPSDLPSGITRLPKTR